MCGAVVCVCVCVFLGQAAFRAEKGNALVVADYGQLELRLLAHITNCESMIAAFKVNGDHCCTVL